MPPLKEVDQFLDQVIDPVSILILICPIALPIVKQIGMDPVHFGVILTVNISIGALYPPVGLLFVTSHIGKVPYYDISKAIMPRVLLRYQWHQCPTFSLRRTRDRNSYIEVFLVPPNVNEVGDGNQVFPFDSINSSLGCGAVVVLIEA